MNPDIGDPEGVNLAAAVQAGDLEAEARFVTRYRPRLLYLARRDLFRGNDAEDLVQDVLAAALVALRKGVFKGEGTIGAWLAAILRGKRIDAHRRGARDPASLAFRESTVASQPRREIGSVPGPVRDINVVLEVRQVLGVLPPLHRAVLILNQVDGFTTQEIAARLRRPPGTIGRVLAEAKQRFRQAALCETEESRTEFRLSKGEPV